MTGPWRKTIPRVLSAGLIAAGVAVSAFGAGCSNDEGITSPCPPGQTCNVNLTILHTSDIHSRLLPYDLVITQADADLGLGAINTVANVGGVARRSTVLGPATVFPVSCANTSGLTS